MAGEPRPFLTANWLNLLMLNYVCPAELLDSYLPNGVELDTCDSQTLISVVGFMFTETKVRGVVIPGHVNFAEVNLRFYVRRLMPDGELRRGVVFIRELVPKQLVATVAKTIYDEPYQRVPLTHEVDLREETGGAVTYRWGEGENQIAITGTVSGPAEPLQAGSQEEFITEHYWGYTRRKNGTTSEYQVLHPRWNVWKCDSASLIGDTTLYYGARFAEILTRVPASALVAVGSAVQVFPGRSI
ncbi:MAG: DUF2071 domain-containing protein [Fimbriimonadaceae bacterium]|nr:DUF2071 domain-containing protein [Fimbriimonadaceae bacterium]